MTNKNKPTILIFLTSLLFWIIFILPLPLYFLLSILTIVIGQKVRYRVIITLCYFYCWFIKYVCGLKYNIVNPENIPTDPCVIVSNHQSMWETCVFNRILKDIVFILKREILMIPLFGWGINGIAPIAIDRTKGDLAMQKLTQQGRQRITAGFSLLIFPEGTRLKIGQKKQFKYGAVKIATLLDTTITPIAINSGVYWPKKSFFIYPGIVTVVVGKAIEPPKTEDDCVEATQAIQDWIYTTLDNITDQE